MPMYKGGGCKSPIYDYNTGNGGMKPDYHHGDYPKNAITRKHPAPRGEGPKSYDDRTPSHSGKSGSQYYATKAGKTALSGKESKGGRMMNLNQGLKRSIPIRDRFNKGINKNG